MRFSCDFFSVTFFLFSAFSNRTLNSSKLSWPSPSVSSLTSKLLTSSLDNFFVSFPRSWPGQLGVGKVSLKVSTIPRIHSVSPSYLSLLPLPFLSRDEPLLVPVQSPEGELRPGHDVRLEIKWNPEDHLAVCLSHLGHFSIVIFVKTLEEEVRALDDFEEVFLGEESILLWWNDNLSLSPPAWLTPASRTTLLVSAWLTSMPWDSKIPK